MHFVFRWNWFYEKYEVISGFWSLSRVQNFRSCRSGMVYRE